VGEESGGLEGKVPRGAKGNDNLGDSRKELNT